MRSGPHRRLWGRGALVLACASLPACAWLAGLTELRRGGCVDDCCVDDCGADDGAVLDGGDGVVAFACGAAPCDAGDVCCAEADGAFACTTSCTGTVLTCTRDVHCGSGLACCGQPGGPDEGGVGFFVCATSLACTYPPCLPDGGCAQPGRVCETSGPGLPPLCR